MSAVWDPGLYLRYADERGRPFTDLVSRITSDAATVVDLGCGPGQLTPVLRARWPEAQITGLDFSAEMIAQAQEHNSDPRATYAVADAVTWHPDGQVDVLVSNAMLQWIPDHADLLQPWTEHIAPGGTLAFQVPGNFDAPSHQLLWEIAARPAYASFTAELGPRAATRDPADYLGLLSRPGWSVDAWETTYLHVLAGDDPVFEWISGTGARPVLQALPADVRSLFERDYKAALRAAYPRRDHGTVLPFRRIFVVAHRSGL